MVSSSKLHSVYGATYKTSEIKFVLVIILVNDLVPLRVLTELSTCSSVSRMMS